ncbi:MAG: hypothetical protein KDA28_01645, partial [Phycisphaerales bacterium]|nr:hypothetical protein [Phycisphaerales bacterium]
MIERLALLWPEIVLFATTCVVMVVGLSPNPGIRRGVPFLAGVGLLAATVLGLNGPNGGGLLPFMMPYAKAIIGGVGLLLLMLLAGTVDREDEERIDRGEMRFNPLRSNIAEFYAFFLFSLTGLMLCATANDLVWLFLALELTSLPTYIMVTISTRTARSQEAGVKYFFLGALGAAIFLYGFAMLYGGTGTTRLWGTAEAPGIAEILASQGMNSIALLGILLSI